MSEVLANWMQSWLKNNFLGVLEGPLSIGKNSYLKVQQLVSSFILAEVLEEQFRATKGLKSKLEVKIIMQDDFNK